ncbi:MmgE/PrpD family protein [Chloroflexota bacterium]
MTTEQVANFIADTLYEQLPQEAIGNAKRAILDNIGVTLACLREPSAQIIKEYVKELGGEPSASVICGDFKTSIPNAALANGTMAHALEYDDYDLSKALHPSVSVLPAVLALGETLKISGKEALLAYILGREVESKLAGVIGSEHYKLGWHTTAIVGAVGAAAASAKILKLNKHQTKMALGIGASQSAGMKANLGSFTKAFHAGNAARSGVVAAQLAQKGFTASDKIVEGEGGFLKILRGDGEHDTKTSLANLDSCFDIVSPGVNIKCYPCCAFSYGAIDAVLILVEQHNINPNEVAKVQCELSSLIPQQVMVYSQPKTVAEAKLSLEYCLAVACLDREVSLRQFSQEKLGSRRIHEFMKKIEIIPVAGAAAITEAMDIPQKATIILKSGNTYSHQVDIPKGDHRNPVSDEDLAGKYRDCAGLALSNERIEQSLRLLQKLEDLQKIAALVDILR